MEAFAIDQRLAREVDLCRCDPAEAYRFLTTELMAEEIEDPRLPGWTSCFIYDVIVCHHSNFHVLADVAMVVNPHDMLLEAPVDCPGDVVGSQRSLMRDQQQCGGGRK
jgi:hypothetical protein